MLQLVEAAAQFCATSWAIWGQTWTISSLPLETLVVNVLGCGAIGIMAAFLVGPHSHHRETLRLVLAVGLPGGFRRIRVLPWTPLNCLMTEKAGKPFYM